MVHFEKITFKNNNSYEGRLPNFGHEKATSERSHLVNF